LNDLQAQIHHTDLSVKKVRAENKMLDKNSTAVFRNFIIYMIKQGEKDLEELGKYMGVIGKELKPFMDKLIDQGVVEEKDSKYHFKEKQ
jgi:predicted transcriptional regulator